MSGCVEGGPGSNKLQSMRSDTPLLSSAVALRRKSYHATVYMEGGTIMQFLSEYIAVNHNNLKTDALERSEDFKSHLVRPKPHS